MVQEKNAKQRFSRRRLVFLTLAFLTLNFLILGWSGIFIDSVEWLLILILDSFLLVSALLVVYLWRRDSIVVVKGESLDDELDMATVILDRLKKYARDEGRENAESCSAVKENG